jgi:hypothetical protein
MSVTKRAVHRHARNDARASVCCERCTRAKTSCRKVFQSRNAKRYSQDGYRQHNCSNSFPMPFLLRVCHFPLSLNNATRHQCADYDKI